MLSVKQQQKDIEVLCKKLTSIHPDYLDKQKNKHTKRFFKKLKKSIRQERTNWQFNCFLIKQFNKYGLSDSHTKILLQSLFYEYSQKKKQGEILYLNKNKIFTDSLYISFKYNKLKSGFCSNDFYKLIEINGCPVQMLLKECFLYASGDTKEQTTEYYKLNLSFYLFCETQYNSTLPIVYENNGVLMRDTIIFKKHEMRKKNKFSGYSNELICNDSLDYAVLNLRNFIPSNKNTDEAYRKFLNNSFAKINEKGIKNLFINLTRNSGGNSTYGLQLLEYVPFKKRLISAGNFFTRKSRDAKKFLIEMSKYVKNEEKVHQPNPKSKKIYSSLVNKWMPLTSKFPKKENLFFLWKHLLPSKQAYKFCSYLSFGFCKRESIG